MYHTLLEYIEIPQVLVVTGMRRVGKTTVLLQLLDYIQTKNKVFIDFENLQERLIWESSNYETVRVSLESRGLDVSRPSYVLIDELQFVKNAPSVIKYLYDTYHIKFIVTGSSSYYIKNHFNQSLAGRKLLFELHPLSFQEFCRFKGEKVLQNNLSWQEYQDHSALLPADSLPSSLFREYTQYGGFPEVVLQDNSEVKQKLLEDIVTSYFQIDVVTFADFADTTHLYNLLRLLTQRIGQRVNVQTLSSVMKLRREQIYEYLECLTQTYAISLLSQKSSIDNQVSSFDKVYFEDVGFAQAVSSSISAGQLLENAVFMNIRKHQLTYYQTRSGQEIDFIVEGSLGLEVKQTVSTHNLDATKKRAQAAGVSDWAVVGDNPLHLQKVIFPWDVGSAVASYVTETNKA